MENSKKKGDDGEGSDESVHELDMIAEFKKREEGMQQELVEKQQEIDKLKQQNQELIKQQVAQTSNQA